MPSVNPYLRPYQPAMGQPQTPVNNPFAGFAQNPYTSSSISDTFWGNYQAGQTAADKAKAEREIGYKKLEDQIGVATNPQLIKDYYSQVLGQLGSNAATQAARSRSSAAATFAQRGTANPSAAISAVGNQAMAPYQATQSQSAISQADALAKIETKKFELMYLVNRARQGDANAIAQLELEKARLAAAQEAGEAGWADYFGIALDVGAAILSGGATIPLSVGKYATKGSGSNVSPEYVNRPFSLQG